METFMTIASMFSFSDVIKCTTACCIQDNGYENQGKSHFLGSNDVLKWLGYVIPVVVAWLGYGQHCNIVF